MLILQLVFFIFSRYEWKHRGSAHIHGFIWLQDAQNMDTFDWNNETKVVDAKNYFDQYITAYNLRHLQHHNPMLHQSTIHDPCLLDTTSIFASTLSKDYEELFNCVQQHTKCHESFCLCKKDNVLSSRYGVPWEFDAELPPLTPTVCI